MLKQKTIVVMPAYNAADTLERTINDIPFTYVDEIILVDDASQDRTVEWARQLGKAHLHLTLDKHIAEQASDKILFTIAPQIKNGGYGSNQKRCYHLALEHGADIVVMLHPDYQYDPKLIKYFIEFIHDGYFHVMLGSRIRSRKEALDGGMPLYKYVANRFLSGVENIMSGRVLSDWHTGMRAYKKEVLKDINFDSFSDDFIFDTQMLFAVIEKGYLMGDIPVPVRYFKEASSINFSRSLKYGLLTLWETAKFGFRKLRG
jgi:glycosyltransferase involved in cell wall biosynthesis